jgi:hypothetical protein
VPRGIRLVDLGLAAWAAVWIVAAAAVHESITGLEDGGRAVATAGEGLEETSEALDRASGGLRQTAAVLGVAGRVPFVEGDPGAAVAETAEDVGRLAERVRETGADARATGAEAEDAAGTLGVVLALAVALGPTLPALFLYLLLRPLVAARVGAT